MKKILLFAVMSLCAVSLSWGQANVTFSVDMSGYAVPFTTPEVNGNFNGWCGNCNPLTNMGGGIWETTIFIGPGEIEYKFSHDNWTGQESYNPGDNCTKTTGAFTNRRIFVGDVDVILPTIAWGELYVGSCPTVSDVNFCVDMNEYAGPGDPITNGVFVHGEFNGWCGTCWPLDDMDGDGIWCGTFPVPNNEWEYVFLIGPDIIEDMAALDGQPCTITTGAFTNRLINVDGDVTLPAVLWESCDVAPEPVIPTMSQWALMILALIMTSLGVVFISRRTLA